jgi:hypothetical protein
MVVGSVDCEGSIMLKLAKMPGSCRTVVVWPPMVTVPVRD